MFLNLGFWINILRCISALQAFDIVRCRKFSLEIRLHVSMLLSLKWPNHASQNCFHDIGSGERDTEVKPGMKETWGLHGLVKDCTSVAGRLMDDSLWSFYPHILPLKLCFMKRQTFLQNRSFCKDVPSDGRRHRFFYVSSMINGCLVSHSGKTGVISGPFSGDFKRL